MIQGLKVTVIGTKVYELLMTRIAHHDDRKRFYAEKAEQLKGVDVDAGVSGGNALQQMEGKRDQHLERSDLQRLGIVQNAW